jgi:hypothetical protein
MLHFDYNERVAMETISTVDDKRNKRKYVIENRLVTDSDESSSSMSLFFDENKIKKSALSVRFSAHLSYSDDAPRNDDDDELISANSLWYHDGDYERFRNENKVLVRFALALYQSNSTVDQNSNEDTLCLRGLEHRVYDDFKETCQASRKSVIRAVLVEQQRQRRSGAILLNDTIVRKRSIRFSKECKQIARTLGKLDAKESC